MIDVDRVLEELSQQRRERAGISTTSVNLVAFVEEDPQLLARMSERLDDLAERNVSRILLLSCEGPEYAVRSHSIEIDDTLITHSEQIQVAVRDVAAHELRSAVHALLVPNVRTVLLWGGPRLDDERFDALGELADTIVLFSSLSEGTQALREIVQRQGTPVGEKIHDLAYLRLLTWQDLVAQFFDDPDLAEELPHISRAEVVSGSSPEAYYLIGWLASRLGWDPCGKNELCNADGTSIAFDLRKRGTPRRVYRVGLHGAHCDFGVEIEEGAEDLICLTVEGEKHRPQRCVPLHDVDMLDLVERAIFMPRNAVYTETLQMVARLLDHQT